MRTILLVLAVSLAAACGTETIDLDMQLVRGAQVHYAPGVAVYPPQQIEFLLDGMALVYWHGPVDWTGVRVLLVEHPSCLAASDMAHQLAHGLRERWDGGYDPEHADRRYWGAQGGGATRALTERVNAWFAVQQCLSGSP